jgi:hypothetical protein
MDLVFLIANLACLGAQKDAELISPVLYVLTLFVKNVKTIMMVLA